MAASLIKGVVIDPGDGRIPAGEIMQMNNQWKEVIQADDNERYCEYYYVIPKDSNRNLVFSMENFGRCRSIFEW